MPSPADDNIPLSQLLKRKKEAAAKKASTSQDDVPLSQLLKKKTAKPAAARRDDDNIPLSELIKRKKGVKPSPAAKRKKAAPAAKSPARRKRANSSSTAGDEKRVKQETSSVGSNTSAMVTEKVGYRKLNRHHPLKPQAIESVLIRWQYCPLFESWVPKPITKEPSSDHVPEGYIELLGFPGVFAGVKGEFLGDLIDKRPKDVVPSKQYLETLSSAQLKELWIAALKNQMKVLEENEGPKAPMLHALQSELKEAQGFNSALADKEAEKRSRRRA